MVAWHRSGTADIGLRVTGLLLCIVAYLSISLLIALQTRSEQAMGAGSFILAANGFLSASVGSAMTCLGNHLFDRVEISARWGSGRLLPNDDAPQTHGSGDHDAQRTGWNARLA